MNEQKSFFQMRISEFPFITFFFLIVMCSSFFIMVPIMFSVWNIMNIALQMTFILLIVMGQAIVILSGNVDLSIGAVVGTSAMIFGVLVERELGLGVAMIVALAFCLVIGGINGLLVAKCKYLLPNKKSKFVTLVLLKLPSIVITFVMGWVIIRSRRMIGGSYRMMPLGESVRLERSTFLSFFVLVLLLLIALWIILEVSKGGKGIYALGNALDLRELPVRDVMLKTVKCYMVSALFAGLAGLFLVFRLGAASPLFGIDVMELTILVAIIGGISIRGGQGLFIGVLIGALYEATLRNGLVLLNVGAQSARIIILTVLIILAALNIGQSILIRRAREKVSSQTSSDVEQIQ